MAKKHLGLCHQIMNLWRLTGRGLLFPSQNGKFKTGGNSWIVISVPGMADLTGYEYDDDGKAISCYVEIKSLKDYVKPLQKEFLTNRAKEGCRCYIGKENSKGQLILRRFPYENGQKEVLL